MNDKSATNSKNSAAYRIANGAIHPKASIKSGNSLAARSSKNGSFVAHTQGAARLESLANGFRNRK